MFIMKIKHIASAVALGLILAGQASAATFEGASGAASNVVTDYSAPDLLSFDIDLAQLTSVTLNFRVEAADLVSSQLSFNSLVRNLSGQGLGSIHVVLNGATFASPPSSITTDGFAAVSGSGASSTVAWASFSPALTSEFYIGNPLLVPGASDWTLSLAGRQVGDAFSVTVAVPEPETYAMAFAGLGVLGLMARRRRQDTR